MKRVRFRLVIGLIFLLFVTLSLQGAQQLLRRTDRLIALDVGQGDAILIDLASGRQVLIDGGAGDAVLGALSEVMLPWDRSIDLVVLTHPDRDHLEGLLSVLDRYDVTTVLTRTLPEVDTQLYQKWLNRLESTDAETIEALPDQRITLDDSYWLGLYIDTTPNLDTNDSSLILTLNREENCAALLTGDASIQVEQRLITDTSLDLRCEVLKASHHGSKTGTSQALLDWVTPKVILISVGRNNTYGHPHPEVLSRLTTYDVYRTDEMGHVVLEL